MENMKYCPVHKTFHKECHNPNHHHHHEHNNKYHHFHIRKNLLSKTYIIIFLSSVILLLIISLLSLILLLCNINYPRIFLPAVIIYIGTFICGGGILGSYGPIDNQELNYIFMRKCASIAMLLICLIVFPFFFFQNLTFFISVKDSKDFCLENEYKSKEEIYIDLIKEKDNLNHIRNNYNNILKNGLTCFEKQKCVKSILDSDSFICNYNYAEIMKENIDCKKIYETEHLVNNLEDTNVANFASSCLELKKELIKPEKELYKCSSYLNLCKADSINDEEENKKIENYYDEKDNSYKKKIIEVEKKLKKIKFNNYSYEINCLSNFLYNFILSFSGIHILINFGISLTWVILGIFSILKNCGFIEDSEKKYYKEMMEKANKIYEQMNPSKQTRIEPEENTPLNLNVK